MKLAVLCLGAASMIASIECGWAGSSHCDRGDQGCVKYCRNNWNQEGWCKKWWDGEGDWSKVGHCCCLHKHQYRLSCPGWDGLDHFDDSYRPKKPVPVTFNVNVEHVRQHVKNQKFHKTEYHKSSNYKKEMKSVSVNLSGSGSKPLGPKFSGSLGVQHLKATETQATSENLNSYSSEVTFQSGKSQIHRIVTIKTNINGEYMKQVQNQFVDADDATNARDLKKMSIDYLNDQFVDNGNPRINANRATFETTVYRCDSRFHILRNGKCYKSLDFSFDGKNLWGYDGAFAPTPEPYLMIRSDATYWYYHDNVNQKTMRSVKLYDIWDYERIYNENENPSYSHKVSIAGNVGSTFRIELKDNDDRGKDDLMCDASISRQVLLERIAAYGQYMQKLDCREKGEAHITFSV